MTSQTQEGAQSVLKGFTIQHGNASFGGGARLLGTSPTIVENVFRDNGLTASGSAIDGNGSSATIERNVFAGNSCDDQYLSGVVSFYNTSSPHIINNVFSSNPCRAIDMTLPVGSNPVVANNTIVRNNGGIRVDAECGLPHTSMPTTFYMATRLGFWWTSKPRQ